MSQGLSGLVPCLSLEDQIYQTDSLVSLNSVTSLPSTELSSLSSHSTGSCGTVQEEEEGFMDVRVIPAAFQRSNSKQCYQIAAYDMCRRPRGLAIIIDIEVYENNVQERRFGSNVDVQNMKALLTGLEFDVLIEKNLHLSQFFEVITEFCSDKRHKEADMTVVVILSHGKDGVVYAADGQSINMEYIYEFFNNRNCPLLLGKPKFFIVQACRGDRPDQGVDSGGVFTETPSPQKIVSQYKRRRTETLDAIASSQDSSDVGKARPTWEDMIIAYSTIPGYASLRDHDKGTWFLQSLVEVFMTHAHDTELVDLLRMTSERLSQFTNEMGDKQTCNIEMRHLYKRIYFNPGLGLPVMVSRSQSMPPCSQERVEQEFLNPPRKVKECFQQPSERKSSVKKKSSSRKCNQMLLSPSVEEDIGSKDVKLSRKIKLWSLKGFRMGRKYRIQN